MTLRKSSDQVVAGVCGGLAEAADMDPTLMRVLYVVATLLTGVLLGIVVYVVLAVVMEEPASVG